ncbi:BnaC09g52220D [Brassica napus]|uniref:BnaC09g52220D protein n=1 Tax=Brassica napus TaxID=3708 RepID=A0A078ILM6_BRANA|nr:BnaC09g52220D [Brassica napus]
MVSIWLLLVVSDHGYRWGRSALHQKEQTGRDNDHSYSLYFFDAGYWCYSRVRIGSIEYIHPTAYVVFFGTVVAVAAFGLYLVEGGKDQVIFWRCDYRFCCSKLYTNVVCIYAGSKCIIRQLETIKRFSRW